jgi:hypothetical protein
MLGVVGSGERTHFRNLSKRTRARIEESVERRNEFAVKEARQELKKLKSKQTEETVAHPDRMEKVSEKSKAASNDAKLHFKEQLIYWQQKSETLQTKKVKP